MFIYTIPFLFVAFIVSIILAITYFVSYTTASDPSNPNKPDANRYYNLTVTFSIIAVGCFIAGWMYHQSVIQSVSKFVNTAITRGSDLMDRYK